jgi:hypothetical protein
VIGNLLIDAEKPSIDFICLYTATHVLLKADKGLERRGGPEFAGKMEKRFAWILIELADVKKNARPMFFLSL